MKYLALLAFFFALSAQADDRRPLKEFRCEAGQGDRFLQLHVVHYEKLQYKGLAYYVTIRKLRNDVGNMLLDYTGAERGEDMVFSTLRTSYDAVTLTIHGAQESDPIHQSYTATLDIDAHGISGSIKMTCVSLEPLHFMR